jgi:adenylate kinase family enzyme
VLTAHAALPASPTRILVAGTSGSGKTTLAAQIAGTLGIRHIEIDALFHGPNWTPRPEFENDVRRFVAEPTWVTEWQYNQVRPVLAEHADLLVWLDYPRPLVMSRVVVRTLRRRLFRRRLWNGNREQPLLRIFTDREHIVRWSWNTHADTTERVQVLAAARPELPIVRLAKARDADLWLAGPLTRSRPG